MKTTSRVDMTKLTSVYSGIEGKCCCGCAGDHYKVGLPESKRMINKVVNIIDRALESEIDDGGSYKAVIVGKRVYIAYFD